MKKIKIKIAVISVLLALVALFVVGCWLQDTAILPTQPIDRTGQDLSLTKAPGLADDLALAITTPVTAPLLTAASTVGIAGQFEVYTASLTGFPTEGSSYALMSTGNASGIAGVATTFYSFDTGGPSSPPFSHRGNPSYDIAKLSLTLSVPPITTLSFDWKFGTEENPTYIGEFGVIDWASAIVTTTAGSTNILLFPDDNPVDVNNAIPYSNAVTGTSVSPLSPYPSPDHTVYNAVTGMYTSSFDITPFVGETITIDFWVGDELDRILDSALFIDNLNFEGEIDLFVDIKPQSCPNPLNVKGKGVLPVAILGTEDFDVTKVDPATVMLEGVSPLRWALEDVATPKGELEECTTLGPDGYLDLTLKFKTQEIVAALGGVFDGDVLVLTLTGNLLNGVSFEVEDVIIIIKKGN